MRAPMFLVAAASQANIGGAASAPVVASVTVVDDLAPTAVLDVPAEIGVGTNLVLDGKRSWDVNGQVVRWEWRHVDGPVSSQLIGLPRDTNVSNYTVPADPASGMRPELKIVHTSGYPKGAMVHQDEPRFRQGFIIMKPYRREELQKIIRDAFEKQG